MRVTGFVPFSFIFLTLFSVEFAKRRVFKNKCGKGQKMSGLIVARGGEGEIWTGLVLPCKIPANNKE